ncbi:hypothetical protein [Candidatus Vidania fulgoroideorum]
MKFLTKNIIFFSKKNNINYYYKNFYKYFKKNLKKKIKLSKNIIEISGTGGDKKNTFNISSSVFIIILLMKIPCVKLGGKKITSNSGSLNFIKNIFNKNIFKKSFFYSNGFYYSELKRSFKKNIIKKKILNIRKKITKPTIYNYIFPTINIFKPNSKILGLSNIKIIKPILKSIIYEKIRRFIVVNSFDGMDELSIFSSNYVVEIKNKKIIKTIFFFKKQKKKFFKKIISKNTKDSIKIFLKSIMGKNIFSYNIIALNCSVILYILNYTKNLYEGYLYVKYKMKNNFFYKLFCNIKYDIKKNNY